jgi:cytochrome P450 family 6
MFFNLPVLRLDPEIVYLTRKLRQWHAVVKKICDHRRGLNASEEKRDPHNDCLQALLDAGLTIEDICDQITTIFAAGFDTTSSLISFTLYRLANTPAVQTTLKSEISQVLSQQQCTLSVAASQMEYCRSVLQETMRLSPIIPVITRDAVMDCAVDVTSLEYGQTKMSIPKGTTMLIPLAVLHRDASVWQDANTFVPGK